MHITLIKPKIGRREKQDYVDEGRMEPLMLAVLAGLTPDEHELVLWDDRFEDIPYEEPTDLVGITVEIFTAKRAYEIADSYRSRGVPVVMGGMHATLLPQEVAQHCDALVMGDAEQVWPQLLEDVQNGTLKSRYQGECGIAQAGTLPDRSIFTGKGYLPISLMQFSRGCPHECIYCATSAFFQHTHHVRPSAEVLEEIGEKKILFFVDDNFTANREAAKELLRALIPLKILWVSQISLDAARDDELLDLMKRSGCMGFVAGFESISPANVSLMGKGGVNTAVTEVYRDQIRKLKDYGFQIWAAFTLGHDFDTKSSIEDTIAFAIHHKFSFAAFNILLPYPRTELYRQLEEENRLLFDGNWWLHPDYRFNHAAFIPKNMEPEELTALGMKARKEFNSFPSIIRRAFDFKTNMRSLPKLLIYLRYSLLFKKEVRKKEGMLFGVQD
jgi:radical SAM superfamily enzyme YgiQ (UPF0313 family)